MPRRNYEITRMLREDLLSTYRKVAASGCHTQFDAWKKTLSQPAPRYYVTPKRAYLVLCNMVKGDFTYVDHLHENRRRMFYSLYNKLLTVSQQPRFMGKSLWFICQFLVNEQAPEFFIAPGTIAIIFSNCKRYGLDYRYYEIHERDKRKKQKA